MFDADRPRAGWLPLLAVAAAFFVPARAAGDEPSVAPTASGQAEAEALFVEGKQLMAAGKYAPACAKLAASERLDPAAGTLMNLADCYEKNAQLASAWVTFREAVTAAERDGRASWAEQAAARARLIEPRMQTLTIMVDPLQAADTDLEIARDGVVVARSAWGSAIPVDASTERIEARAPGKKTWTTSVAIEAEHARAVVEVPALEPLPAASPLVSSPDKPRRAWQKPASLAVLGGGVIAAGIGAYYGVTAINENNQAGSVCPNPKQCPTLAGQTLSQEARSAGSGSNIAFGTAAALAGAAVILFFTAPSSPRPPAVQAGLSVGGIWGVTVDGAF
jgi:hypothetical protein